MQIQALWSVKPRTFNQWRLHAIITLALDTGVRIDEALTLRVSDVDFDDLLVTVFGNGRKERRIPFSFELRKVLYRWQQVRDRCQPGSVLVFSSRQGTTWDQRNSLRDTCRTCDRSAPRELFCGGVAVALGRAPHSRNPR